MHKMDSDWWDKNDPNKPKRPITPTTPFDNSLQGSFEHRDGKFGRMVPTSITQTDLSRPQSAATPKQVPTWKFEPISDKEINDLTSGVKKYTLQDTEGNVQVVYASTPPQNPDFQVVATDNLTRDEQEKFYANHYNSTRQTTGYVAEFDSKTQQNPVDNITEFNIGNQNLVRKDDGTTTTFEKIAPVIKDAKVFQQGFTIGELGDNVPAGRIVLKVIHKDGKVSEVYSDKEYGNGMYSNQFEAMNKISRFEKNPSEVEKIIQIGDVFFLAQKQFNAVQGQNGPEFDNTSVQTIYRPIVHNYDWKSEKEANKYFEENKGTSNAVVASERFTTGLGLKEDLQRTIK